MERTWRKKSAKRSRASMWYVATEEVSTSGGIVWARRVRDESPFGGAMSGPNAGSDPSGGVTPFVSTRLFDYFLVCGLDIESGLEPDLLAGDHLHCSPLDRPYKGKILAHYPANVVANPFDEHSVCMFCLPSGLSFRTQKHALEPEFHSFVITREDASRYYGFSLVFYEEVRNKNICSAMHTLQAMYITELSSGQTPPSNRKISKETCRSLPRSFKLSPHVSGAAVSYYDVTKDKLYVSKSIGLICRYPYVRAARLFLSNIYKSLPRQPGPGLSPEAFVYNILYEVNLPTPGQSIKFYLPPTESHMSPVPTVIYRPSLPDELPLLDYQLREMFTLLGADCILQLFTCVLLENQVLLRSSDYNRLMLVAECITSLLFPYTWPHVYVPILPNPLHHFLDAPVPFLMGLHLECTSSIGMSGNGINKGIFVGTEAAFCLVDIDKMIIQLPEELPIFPYKNEFLEEIYRLLDKFQISKPDFDQSKFHTPINGVNQRYNYHDPMSSSCTLPSGGGSRRKHSFNDILDWDESHAFNNSPPSSPTHYPYYHSSHYPHQTNRITPPRSDALQRIVDIARRTGVNIDDLDSETIMPAIKKKNLTDDEQYQEDLKFNNAIRETFLNRFVHMFSAYEHFVIFPDQDKESWLSCRESMQNFDKAAFLSDQPEKHRPFLSRFLESQMFATLIDNKIMSTWGEIYESLQLFDNRIKILRKRYGGDSLPVRSSCYEPCLTRYYESFRGDKKLDTDEMIPPQEIHPHRAAYYRAFPLLDAKLLEPPLVSCGERMNSLRRVKNTTMRWQTKDIAIDTTNLDASRKTSTETNNPITQNNKAFIEKLLKDCKSKTKKMLLEKMGSEAVDLGLGVEVSIVGVEENTMIASLCDLLERIWSHGLQHKYGKSALWMHLLNYQELEQCSNTSKPIDPSFLTPDLNSVSLENDNSVKRQSPNRSRDSSRSSSRDSSRDRLSSGSNTLERKQNTLPLRPLPENLTFDMRNIQAMSDIKTEIGYARAWVRLSLEKKLLSKHLKTLVSDTALLKSQYKRTAFLRCEDEREQFLYHLLTLNAVDYYCFTNTYPLTKLPYRVVVVPSRKASATTANCWISISGTSGETQQISIPRNTLEFVFHHKNLGILTTLRIGHDNSGLSPRWMIENVYVRNEVTGHTYRFPCNRWLGRGVDDGSTERLLVAQIVNSKNSNSNTSTLGRYGQENAGSSSNTAPASPAPVATHLSPSTVQHMIGDCVNAIVKWHYRSKREKDANSLSVLLCGENGLVKCLEQAFLCGFKSNRLFGRNLFIWDYFVRVKEVFEQNLSEECVDSSSESSSGIYSYHSSNTSTNRSQEHTTIWRCYCHLMDEINNAGHSLGKDGKFQLFICLSLREHWLHRMLVPMSVTRVTTEMYEEQSFMRKRGLLTFLRQILEPLDEFNIVLENSLTQGISSYP